MKMINLPSQINNLMTYLKNLSKTWVWEVVLLPFIITRLIWLCAAWFVNNSFFPAYPHFRTLELSLSTNHLLDIFTRYDGAWYLSIVTGGYSLPKNGGSITSNFSNIAFYPLYPYLVKMITPLLPSKGVQDVYLAFGLILSNLFFLAASILLYKLIVEFIDNETIARKTLLLLFIFPTSFYFSCFYTESLFLFLSLAAITALLKNKWIFACLLSVFCSLTRPPGLLILIPLLWVYLKNRNWNIRKIHPDILWITLAPAAVAAHYLYLYPRTGTLIAPILAERAWNAGNIFTLPMDFTKNVINSQSLNVNQIDFLIWLLFLIITLVGMWKMPSRWYGIYALVQLLLPINSGAFASMARYAVVIFPTFIMLARILEKRRSLELFTTGIFFTFQIIFFTGFANYYWIA